MPTKLGVHAFYINPYLLYFFQLILFFDPLDYNSPWSDRKLFEEKQKGAKSLKPDSGM